MGHTESIRKDPFTAVNNLFTMILVIWNSYICTAVKKRIWEILAAKNTTELVVENRTWKKKKIQTRTGFEPMTSEIPVYSHSDLRQSMKRELQFQIFRISSDSCEQSLEVLW